MKNIYTFLIATTLLFGSCTLDRNPETTLGDSNFWKTETDLRGACNRLYIDLDGFYHDMRSDELVGTSANSISSGNWTVPGTSDNWTGPYAKIGVANNIIAKGASAPLADAVKNRWLAEAYFFRAYHYFDLVKKYGDVPLILKVFDTTNDSEIKKARTPREEVIQKCYSDLEFSKKWLPDINDLKDDTNWGRVSRSAALGLMVRIGLYEGTYSKYHNLGNDYKNHLKKSIDAAETLIKEGKHSLYPDFQALFTFAGEGRQNKENLFVKVYGPNGAGIIVHRNSRDLESKVAATRQMIDMFLYSDGLPREKSPLKIHPENSFNDVFINRDPRMSMTIYQLNEEAYKGPYIPFINQHGFGYPIKKGFMIDQWELSGKETVDKMLIRYAEILLSYSEALYEYNDQITDEQLNATINLIRKRAGFSMPLTNEFVKTKGLSMIDEIRRERIVEFIDEGLHYDDIIRWKTAEKKLIEPLLGIKYVESETSADYNRLKSRLTDSNGNLDGVNVYDEPNIYVIEKASTRSFNQDRDYLYPIPSYEIGTSDKNIIQNPNW